ncbi:MAG TPA: cytochrome c [Thermoanaerobaculia bacterium]|nr:cytochrome c [Thermoanaerobaculia bacterium]
MRTEIRGRIAFACFLLLAAAGCRQNMHNQHKVKTLGASDFFAGGQGARPLPAHTVARGDQRVGFVYSGLDAANKPVDRMPFPVTRELLQRGRERFDIFCSPCHDRLGTGRGMIVRRGYKQPSSYHIERLRNAPIGYFVNVMTEGFGVMPSYAPQVPVEDRWAIAAYIRVLQYSQNVRLADLSPEVRRRVEDDLRQTAAPEPAPHSSEVP